METHSKEVAKVDHMKDMVIPRAIVQALDQVKAAVTSHGRTAQKLVETTVSLYAACRREKIDLPQVEIARRTGASKGYISLIWRAAEAAQAKRKDPMQEAIRLGFRPFVKQYLDVPPRVTGPAPTATTYPKVLQEVQQLKTALVVTLPRINPDERQTLVFELIELLNAARNPLPVDIAPRAPRGRRPQH